MSLSPAGASGTGSCPAVVVIAARGTDQNKETDQYIGPQQYSAGTVPSNGYEGLNLSGLFHLAEARHPTVMQDVYVLALNEVEYPASMGMPVLVKAEEELSFLQLLGRVGALLRQVPLGDLIHSVVVGTFDSMKKGQEMAPQVVDDYEARTGCAPSYITTGYSQGAIIATSLESHLAAKGRLGGAVYLGNPLSRPEDTNVVGNPERGGGLLEAAPVQFRPQPAPGIDRIDYCLRGDFVCDLSASAAGAALTTRMKVHSSYFQGEPSAADALVADRFAGWIKESKGY